MKTLLSYMMLMTCLCPLTLAMDHDKSLLSLSSSPINNPVHGNYIEHKNTLLKDFDLVDYQAVDLYRKAFADLEQEADEFTNVTMVEPMDCLIPLARQALEYVALLTHEHQEVAIFKKEIEYRLESHDVTPLWYHLLGLRIQAAISTISPDELNLFNHVIEPGEAILKGLTKNNAWRSHEKSAVLIENFRKAQNPAHLLSYPLEIDGNVADEVLESLEKMLPAQVYYNVFNKSFMDIPFLIHSYIHDIYPMALPKKHGKAHGVSLSPLSFTGHDFLHAENDPRRCALEQFVLNELAAQIKLGDIELKSAPIILAYAVQRYNLLNETLDSLFSRILAKLNHDHDEIAFKKAMMGFFQILHEEVVFNPDIYTKQSFKDVLSLMANAENQNKVLKEESNFESWNSPSELVVTSPSNGETLETDEEITRKVMDYLKSGKSNWPYINGEMFSYFIDEKAPSKVEFSDRFIDVTVVGKNAYKYRVSIPTLFHKWKNIDDNINLLKYAGITVEKPSIEGIHSRQARVTVLETLKKVELLLHSVTEDFLKTSFEIADMVGQEETQVSLAQAYEAKAHNLKEDYQNQLKSLGFIK